MASITLRNNDSIDIHASHLINKKLFAIQVKTKQIKGFKWMLNAKAEKYFDDKHFYVFVSLKAITERPDFYIVPSIVVAEKAKNSYNLWLKSPGRKGQPHNDSIMRIFEDSEGEFLEKWELLK